MTLDNCWKLIQKKILKTFPHPSSLKMEYDVGLTFVLQSNNEKYLLIHSHDRMSPMNVVSLVVVMELFDITP